MDVSTQGQGLLLKLLDATSQRRDVLISNLANVETPGFQRKVVRFEELLQDALAGGRDPSRIEPVIEVDREAPMREDGNSVSLEKELGGLRENRLMYETYAAILGTHFELMRSAIESGR